MHQTAQTALARVQTSVTRHWKTDAWLALAEVHVGEDIVAHTSMVFDAKYWSAQAVEAVLDVHRAALESSYEL